MSPPILGFTLKTQSIIGVLLGGFLLLLLMSPVLAVPTDDAAVYVENYSVMPHVLAPGDSGTLTVIIKNTAKTATLQESSGLTSTGVFEKTQNTDVKTVIDNIGLNGNGIKVLTDSYQKFGALGPSQSVSVTFNIQAPPQDGIYYPEVWADINGGKSFHYPVPVNVNSRDQVSKDPIFRVEKYLPDSINPGENFSIDLNIKNEGQLRANQAIIFVNTSSESIGVKGPNTLALSDIDGGTERSVHLDLITDKNAPLGLQQVNLDFSYYLPDGIPQRQMEILQIPIKGKAQMNIASVTVDPSTPETGKLVNLIIRLENTGTDTAKSVIASIDLPMEGTLQAFIGKIKIDNDAPAIFSFSAGNPGDYSYNLTINYTDDWGSHSQTQNLHLLVASVNDISTYIILLLIGGGFSFYFLYRRLRGGK